MIDIIKIVIITSSVVAAVAAHFYFNNPKEEKIVDEVLEKVVEYETGIHLDLESMTDDNNK